MNPVERLGAAALHRLPPERAHDLSLTLLARGLVPLPGDPAVRGWRCRDRAAREARRLSHMRL